MRTRQKPTILTADPGPGAQGGPKVQEATVIYSELGDKFGWSVRLYNGAAACAMRMGEWEDAERFLNDAYAKDPKSADSLANLAAVGLHLGKVTVSRTLKHAPLWPPPSYMHGLFRSSGWDDASLRLCARESSCRTARPVCRPSACAWARPPAVSCSSTAPVKKLCAVSLSTCVRPKAAQTLAVTRNHRETVAPMLVSALMESIFKGHSAVTKAKTSYGDKDKRPVNGELCGVAQPAQDGDARAYGRAARRGRRGGIRSRCQLLRRCLGLV